RRIDRAYQTAEILSTMLSYPIEDERPVLEALLEVTDSAMTYRSRYLLLLQPASTIDLITNDETNPRSLRFQLEAACKLIDKLPDSPSEVGISTVRKMAEAMRHLVRMSEANQLAIRGKGGHRHELESLLRKLLKGLPELSNAVAARYLIHTTVRQSLTGRRR
ncbi:MAG: alpha-E domain-containing protein, partial [Planctomycetota bacterium]